MTDPIQTLRRSPQPEPTWQGASGGTLGPKPPSVDEPLSAGASQLVAANLAEARTALLPEHSLRWYGAKTKAELACLLPGDLALRAGKWEMPSGGIAERMLDHFVDGNSQPAEVDLDAEFARNPQLREYVSSRIEFEMAARLRAGEDVNRMNGAIWVPQSAYGDSKAGTDQQLALGGTYFEYQVQGTATDGGLMVGMAVSDHYFWSPSEGNRPTQCMHERGVELVNAGAATEFYQRGEGTLILNDPRSATPMTPLEPWGTTDE